MTSVGELYALQELDLALESNRTSLADVLAHLGESEEVADARRTVGDRQEALRAAEHEFKEREFRTEELRRKIEPIERRLYEGSVRNPKELEDLQQDIDSLKRRRSELDDEALEAMEAVDAAQRALDEARRALQELEAGHKAEQEELGRRQEGLEREIAALEARRSEQAMAVNANLMRLYERLAPTRQGRAVAKVEGGACQGCRISLPMNLLQRARTSSDVVQCSSCERILYVT